ncbi:MAG: hypothetical protein GY953_28095, partial [bacterium]|nr:hypothetical protein [bacterium]
GRVMVSWARHGKDDMYLAVSKRPRDISEFGEPRLVTLNSKEANKHVYAGGRDAYTYASLFAVGETLYLGWRGLDNKPNLAWSHDGGDSWSPGRIYVFPSRTYLNQRPYMKVAAGSGGLHFAFTDGHPNREPENGIHYAFLTGGAFHKADGSPIRRLADAPFGVRDADIVHDARKAKVKSWIWDVAEDADRRPAIVYVRFPDDRDHRYHYARWDGVRWHDHELVASGGWFPQTEEGKTEREPNYSGGLVLDHDDPNTVYLSVPVNGVREIQRWTTRDLGRTWKTEPVTSGSKRDNIRPFAIRNTPGDGPQVMWMTLNSYTHYTRFDSEIKVDVKK